MANQQKPKRRWFALAVIVLILLVVGLGVFAVLQRGQQRRDFLERGVAARRAGDYALAKLLFQEMLTTNPDSPRARLNLIEILMEEDDFASARKLALEWVQGEVDPEDGTAPVPYKSQFYGWKALVDIAFGDSDLAEAARLARAMAHRERVLSHEVLRTVSDVQGRYEDRLRSAQAAEDQAIFLRGGARVTMLLYAAETLEDVLVDLPAESRQTAEYLAKRRDLDLAAAREVLESGGVSGRSLRDLTNRVELLTQPPDPKKRKQAASALQASLTEMVDAELTEVVDAEDLDAERTRIEAALVRYHIAQGEYTEAARMIRGLSGNFLAWWRAAERLSRVEDPEAQRLARDILNRNRQKDHPLVQILEARALLKSDQQADLDRAKELLSGIATKWPEVAPWAMRMLHDEDKDEVALAIFRENADKLVGESVSSDTGLLMELAGDPEGRERVLLSLMSAKLTLDEATRLIETLNVLERDDIPALERYLKSSVPGEGADAAAALSTRAAAASLVFQQLGSEEASKSTAELLKKYATRDLKTIDVGAADKDTLVLAFASALTFGEFELAGHLLGRALALPGKPFNLGGAILGLAQRARSGDAVVQAEELRRFASGFTGGLAIDHFINIERNA